MTIWQTLVDLKWAAVDDTFVNIEGDGTFYLPLIQNMLSHDRAETMRKERIMVARTESHPFPEPVAPTLPEDVPSHVATAVQAS